LSGATTFCELNRGALARIISKKSAEKEKKHQKVKKGIWGLSVRLLLFVAKGVKTEHLPDTPGPSKIQKGKVKQNKE